MRRTTPLSGSNACPGKLALVTLALVLAIPSVASAKSPVHRSHGYTATATHARTCGEFMYWKNGKCEDARNRSRDWRALGAAEQT